MDNDISLKIEQFFSQFALKSYPGGAIIVHAGHDLPGVIKLDEGIVEQYTLLPNGNKSTVNVFKPPAFFPMSWAINHTPNEYFFAAQTDIKYRLADPSQTIAFLQSQPDIVFDLLSRVYRGTDALLKRLVAASSGAAVNRLALELLIESLRFGVEAQDGKRLIKINQNILADRSGLSRETVSRILGKLNDEGIIQRTKNEILVNIDRLQRQVLA